MIRGFGDRLMVDKKGCLNSLHAVGTWAIKWGSTGHREGESVSELTVATFACKVRSEKPQ